MKLKKSHSDSKKNLFENARAVVEKYKKILDPYTKMKRR